MIKEAIKKVTTGRHLSLEDAASVFDEILNSQATPAQVAAFLTALKIKGETIEEITAAAKMVRQRAKIIKVRDNFLGIELKEENENIFDTCGTGGSEIDKFNISTAVAFVVAASGVKVAKHGNRSFTSNCGSADVLSELGININAPVEKVKEAIKKIGIGFLYAPLYHQGLKAVAQVREEIGIKTIFNIIGPLSNPARANFQLIGVYRQELTETLAKVLANLGVVKAFVVFSKDLKDEVTITGKTKVTFLERKKTKTFYLSPRDFGLKKANLNSLLVKNKKEAALAIKDVLSAKPSAKFDVVLANASCAFVLLKKAKGFKEGVKLSRDILESGLAKKKFQELKKFLNNA